MKKLFALLLAIAVVGMAGCSGDTPQTDNNDNNDGYGIVDRDRDSGAAYGDKKTENVDVEAVRDKVDIKAVPTLDGDVCAFITNNSDVVIDELEVQVNYLGSNGQIIDLDTDGHDMILPGYTVVSRLDAPDDYDSLTTECEIGLEEHPSYENHSEQVEVSSNEGDDCIIVQIKNNSDVMIDEIEYVVVLYNGDKVVSVSYENDVMDVAAGKTVTEKVDTFREQFDRFEVYLNQAHTFGL